MAASIDPSFEAMLDEFSFPEPFKAFLKSVQIISLGDLARYVLEERDVITRLLG